MTQPSTQLLKRYEYPLQEDVIELFAPNFICVKFGTITVDENDNTTETLWVKDCFEEIKRLAPGQKLKVIIDFTTIDSGEYNSKESNNIYRAILADEALEKVAVYGLRTGWQLMIDLLRMFVPNKLKTFATEAEALAWLNDPSW